MQIYPADEAQIRFAELVKRAEGGERIGIERDGVLFVLTGISEPSKPTAPDESRP